MNLVLLFVLVIGVKLLRIALLWRLWRNNQNCKLILQWPKGNHVPVFTEEDPTYDDVTETNSVASGSVNDVLDGVADVQVKIRIRKLESGFK